MGETKKEDKGLRGWKGPEMERARKRMDGKKIQDWTIRLIAKQLEFAEKGGYKTGGQKCVIYLLCGD